MKLAPQHSDVNLESTCSLKVPFSGFTLAAQSGTTQSQYKDGYKTQYWDVFSTGAFSTKLIAQHHEKTDVEPDKIMVWCETQTHYFPSSSNKVKQDKNVHAIYCSYHLPAAQHSVDGN